MLPIFNWTKRGPDRVARNVRVEKVNGYFPNRAMFPKLTVHRSCRLDRTTFRRDRAPSWRRVKQAAGVSSFLSVGQLYQTDWSGDRLPIKWKPTTCYFPTRFWCSQKVDVVLALPLLADLFYARPSRRTASIEISSAVSLTRATLRLLRLATRVRHFSFRRTLANIRQRYYTPW